MVDLFFVLSGFVICRAYLNNIKEKSDLLKFLFLRFSRLYPIHITFLLVFLIIEIAKYYASLKYNINSPNTSAFEKNTITALIKNIFLISSLFPNEPHTFNYSAWSISSELYTCLLFSLIILACKRHVAGLFFTIALVSLVALEMKLAFGYDSFIRCLAGFFIGCLTFLFTKDLKITISGKFSMLIFLLLIIFLFSKNRQVSDQAIYFLTAALIISIAISRDGMFKKILRFPALTFLGTISYSIYMSHAAIIWLTNQSIRLVLKPKEIQVIDGAWIPQLTQLQTFFACLTVLIIVLLVSTMTYRLIENPIRQKSRHFLGI